MAYLKHFKSEDMWRAFIRSPDKHSWLLLDAWFSDHAEGHAWLTARGYEVVLR